MTAEEQARRLVEEVIAGWLEVIGLSPRAGVRRKFYGGVHTADLAQRLVRRLVPVFERAEYTDDRLADADANVSRVRKAALHEMNELRARLERAEAEHKQYVAFHEAFADECSAKLERAEAAVARLREALKEIGEHACWDSWCGNKCGVHVTCLPCHARAALAVTAVTEST